MMTRREAMLLLIDKTDRATEALKRLLEAWLEKYANTPDGMAAEMSEFARMEI